MKIIGKGIYDSDGVNIRDVKELLKYAKRENFKPINFTDKEGVILGREDSIKKAIEKQKKVKHTNLPKRIIKVDSRVVGCVYKRYYSILGIYAASLLPLKTRKKVLNKLFIKLKELHDNYIYPLTLAQKDLIFPFSKKGANVLLGYNLEPYLVDLDGISTVYFDSPSPSEKARSLRSFSIMALEILSGIDLYANEEDEYDTTIDEMIARGIPKILAEDIYYENGFQDEERIIKLLK